MDSSHNAIRSSLNSTGSIFVYALQNGSPAIDAGSGPYNGGTDIGCLSTDERGVARPQDGNADGTAVIVIAKLSMKGTSKGKPMDGDYRITQVYRKMPEGWKQITAQATKIESATPSKPEETKPAANANK